VNPIPKQLSFYWSGKNISWLRYLTLYTVKLFNPDWNIRLYVGPAPVTTGRRPWTTGIKQDFFIYKGKNYWSEVEKLDIQIIDWTLQPPSDYNGDRNKFNTLHPPQLCDLFEWETLYVHGGFFADMDIIFLKSLNPLYDQIVESDADSVVCYYRNMFRIGFTAAKQGNKFYKDLFYTALRLTNDKQYESCGAFSIYGMMGMKDRYLRNPGHLLNEIKRNNYYKQILDRYNTSKFFNLDKHNLYHWDHDQLKDIFIQQHDYNVIPENTYGIHWYAGYHGAQEFNNRVNEKNYMTFNSSIGNVIKHILNK